MGLISLLLLKGAIATAKAALPAPMYAVLRRQQRRIWWGGLRRTKPFSRSFGMDRGTPIDRYYIEDFLAHHSADIRGRVLEVGDNDYTLRFGVEKVERSDVLHVTNDNPQATIVGDLSDAPHIPSNSFDCIICTQTLMFIYDVPAAIRTIHRILKPGGTLLASVAGISQICRADMDQWGDYWRFTSLAVRTMLKKSFGSDQIHVLAAGNVLASVGFLHGLAAEEFQLHELDAHDRDYELVVLMKATKQGET